ncbi:hypothetical protein SAMD00023353_5300570 [Rosellinia necatrix]|uniref:Uncharacterized protein n=1 Tax=Rosellinia necatrix TaxID=77044 RepID=A0A1S8AAZ8_ROSNE|nr:hypothetical protein SAMD00023353_5300570 [Rosellinia necatrix]
MKLSNGDTKSACFMPVAVANWQIDGGDETALATLPPGDIAVSHASLLRIKVRHLG